MNFKTVFRAFFVAMFGCLAYACTTQEEEFSSEELQGYFDDLDQNYGVQVPMSAEAFKDTYKLSKAKFLEFVRYAKEGNMSYLEKFEAEQVLEGNISVSPEKYEAIKKEYHERNWEEEIASGGYAKIDSSKKKMIVVERSKERN